MKKNRIALIAGTAVILLSAMSSAVQPDAALTAIPQSRVSLSPSVFTARASLNRAYLMSLDSRNLLQNHLAEAGMLSLILGPDGKDNGRTIHTGWESPTCQLRGHFLGHWLSAAAHLIVSTGDPEVKARADAVIEELGRIQARNGGRWVGSIPEKYLYQIQEGKSLWAPQYTLHKTLMGLVDMAVYGGNKQALEIAENFAGWFYDWTRDIPREKMNDILDVETGGMLEIWAELLDRTGGSRYRELLETYYRARLFDRLIAGEDPLTNRHANTTIPEAIGAARAYEVTGDVKWRRVAEAYWKMAVTHRGTFCTGGQTDGEIWTPPFEFSARLSEKNQEHCTVYNMMRLADFILRWTGDPACADYIEKNLYNGILAQQNKNTGMVSYFLPLHAGAKKNWGSQTADFWCCHGSLVQAHTLHNRYVYYASGRGVTVAQYIPSTVRWQEAGTGVTLSQSFDKQHGSHQSPKGADGPLHRPEEWVVNFRVECDSPREFTVDFRLPGWLAGPASIEVNGKPVAVASGQPGFQPVRRTWSRDVVTVRLPMKLAVSPIPDMPGTVAFLEGPVVLAGLCGEERTLTGDIRDPHSILTPDRERQWGDWLFGNWRTKNQDPGIRFIPLYEVTDEAYTVYFPVRKP
ncbi:MAG: glycoside hydrolase family 127 protein [bacterium]|nr:glycoside hydrolase family 127 protein [bacterium]